MSITINTVNVSTYTTHIFHSHKKNLYNHISNGRLYLNGIIFNQDNKRSKNTGSKNSSTDYQLPQENIFKIKVRMKISVYMNIEQWRCSMFFVCLFSCQPPFSQWQANNQKSASAYFIVILALHLVLAQKYFRQWFGILPFATFRGFSLITLMSFKHFPNAFLLPQFPQHRYLISYLYTSSNSKFKGPMLHYHAQQTAQCDKIR